MIAMQTPTRVMNLALVVCAAAVLHPRLARADGLDVPATYTPPTDAPPVAPQPAPAPQPKSKVTRECLGFVAAGVAVVGVGVGTAFGVLALNSKSAFEANPTVARANTGNQEAVLADVAFGTAVIAGVTSVVLFLTRDAADVPPPAPTARDSVPKSRASFTVAPLVSPHGAGVGAVVHF